MSPKAFTHTFEAYYQPASGGDYERHEVAVEVVPEEATYSLYHGGMRWCVLLDGTLIGHVFKRTFTRERKTKGRTYVNARWESPPRWAWNMRSTLSNYVRGTWECESRKQAIEQLTESYLRSVRTTPTATDCAFCSRPGWKCNGERPEMIRVDEFALPSDLDPTAASSITFLIEQVVRSRNEFNRQMLAEEFISVVSVRYPEAWLKFIRPSNIELVLSGIRSVMYSVRAEAAHREVVSISHQRAMHRLGHAGPAEMHYSTGKNRYVKLLSMRRSEVEASATHMEKTAKGLLNRALLLRAIARRLPTPDALVSDVWTPEQLEAMFGGEPYDDDTPPT